MELVIATIITSEIIVIKKCIDSNCSFNCNCSDSCENNDSTTCMNEVIISNQTISLTNTQFFIEGNITIQQSNVNLTLIDLIAESDLSIINSNILFNSSIIISKGCINITNANITVDLAHISQNVSKLLLLNSTSGCLNIQSVSITYINQLQCTVLTTEKTTYTFAILFNKKSNCLETNNSAQTELFIIILIIVISIVGLAILFIAIVMIVPSFRYKMFPRLKQRKIAKSKKKNMIKNTIQQK